MLDYSVDLKLCRCVAVVNVECYMVRVPSSCGEAEDIHRSRTESGSRVW